MLDFHEYWENYSKNLLFKDSLMKNLSLLILSLVLALPGCCKRRNVELVPVKSPDVVEQALDYTGNVESSDEDFDLSDLEGIDWESIDLDALGEDENMPSADEDDAMEEEDVTIKLENAWVDQQEDEMRKIYFTFNHYGVREDQKSSLHYNVEQLKQMVAESDSNVQPTIVVEGHTDQEGDPSYNFGLSEKRAKTVADLLVASGIDRSLIKVVGRGQECPAVVDGRIIDGSREDRAPNRRVEVRVIYT